jgi:cation:H+ antiporter
MMLLLFLALGLLLVGTVLLVVGADWFLDGAGDLARSLGISALILGVLLAGLEPEEMLTAAIASARGAPTLAVGNVIGTNVTIVTAALGLSALIFPMVIDKRVRRQALIATLVSVCGGWFSRNSLSRLSHRGCAGLELRHAVRSATDLG